MTTAKPLFERGRLTDWLLETLLRPPLGAMMPTPVLVGDAVAPEEGGWSGGEPGQGTFVPYVTLATGPAAPAPKQGLGPGEAWDWMLRYQLRSVGALRGQCDWVADQARAAWDTQGEVRLSIGDGPQWKAAQFVVASMGAVTRNDQVSPPYWEVVDEVSLALSRCRT